MWVWERRRERWVCVSLHIECSGHRHAPWAALSHTTWLRSQTARIKNHETNTAIKILASHGFCSWMLAFTWSNYFSPVGRRGPTRRRHNSLWACSNEHSKDKTVKYRWQKCPRDGTGTGLGGFQPCWSYLVGQKYLSLIDWHPRIINLPVEG